MMLNGMPLSNWTTPANETERDQETFIIEELRANITSWW